MITKLKESFDEKLSQLYQLRFTSKCSGTLIQVLDFT